MRPIVFLSVLLFLAITISICTLSFGPTPWDSVWGGIIDRISGKRVVWNALLDERLPRLIVLFCSGASLAVAGAVMQSLFCNPLASPGVLGISNGGSLLAMLVIMMTWHLSHPFLLPIAAFGGALLTLIFVYWVSMYINPSDSRTIIFVGLAISTVFAAIQGTITYASRDHWQVLQALIEWQGGTTVDRTWKHVNMQLPLTLIGLTGVWFYAKEINLLTMGEEDAKNFGVAVSKVRWRLFLFIAMLVGGAMASLGSLPFFGLVLPHIIRKLLGPNHVQLIPSCVFGGAVSLACLDFFLRLLHIELFSIGDLCSIVGGLFFLFLLLTIRKQQRFVC